MEGGNKAAGNFGGNMDIRIDGQKFENTEAVVSFESEKGKELFEAMFGKAVVSVSMKKSSALEFAVYCEQRGFVVGE